MPIVNSLTNYIKESIAELKKVTWPTRRETINHTLLVIGLSLGMAAFLGALDYLFSLGIQRIVER